MPRDCCSENPENGIDEASVAGSYARPTGRTGLTNVALAVPKLCP